MFGECSGTSRVSWRREPRPEQVCLQIHTKPTEGFEPSTPALRERCSGQLSYVGVPHESSRGARPDRPGGTPRRRRPTRVHDTQCVQS
jgi:hypothetical protein